MVEALDKGFPPWRNPWSISPNTGIPCSVASRKNYTGINPLILMLSSMTSDYDSKYWGTVNAWEKLGARIKEGEKETQVTLFRFINKQVKGKVVNNKKGQPEKVPLMRYFPLYNVAQVEGKTEESDDKLDKFRVVFAELNNEPDFNPAEEFVSSIALNLNHRGSKAMYRPSSDSITMPPKRSFESMADYYETLFHEMIHWSVGRVEGVSAAIKKTNRPYAFEELVAEIGACFLTMEIGVPMGESMMEKSQSYVKAWLGSMENDSKYIFDAASYASKLTDYLMAKASQKQLAA
jgi:antirestriction protein ArdC